jgi:hypothetical protein
VVLSTAGDVATFQSVVIESSGERHIVNVAVEESIRTLLILPTTDCDNLKTILKTKWIASLAVGRMVGRVEQQEVC